jgi:anti-sigma28 factor (negative regulator of flagellin synthesis)
MIKNVLQGSVLVVILTLASSLYAQERQQTQPSPDTPQAGQSTSQPSSQAQSAKEYTGTIVDEGNSLRLKDSAKNANYKLDDEKMAKTYIGKQVRVLGMLDKSTNTIQVKSIYAVE